MDTILIDSGNIKRSDPHRLLLNLTDKLNLKSSDKYVALSNNGKIWKNRTKTVNLERQPQCGMRNFSWLRDDFLYHIFKNKLSLSPKTWNSHW